MDPLDLKLWREFWAMRGQALAIILVIAAGVATYVMSLCTLESLTRAETAYYAGYRFADVFAHAKRAPQTLERRIAEIPGVAAVQTRVVADVKLDVPGLAEPATARLVSVPDRRPPDINQLHLRNGRYVEPERQSEVLVSEGFASAHRLVPGDKLRAVINGRFRELSIVGVALSPEYIYQIREGDLVPDDRRFTVLWMGRTDLEAAFDMKGAFNDVACTLMPGAVEADVLRRLDRLLAPCGGRGAYGRADQSSHKFVANELQELRGMALVAPTIFLAISAFLLNMVVVRLIGLEREQIATLKAFGYSGREIGWHYVKLVLLFVCFGSLLGTLVGWDFGRRITHIYAHFFHFAVFGFYLDPQVVASAVAISAAAAVAGTMAAVRRAASLPPAAGMRPEPPAKFGPTLLERIGFERLLGEPAKIMLRQLERRPLRSALTCLGISLSVAVMIVGSFMVDAIDYAIHVQYYVAIREDLNVLFVEPSSARALHDIERLPGVRHCEPYRSIATRLRHGNRSRRIAVLGLPPDAELHRLMDVHCRRIPLPREGLVLSKKLGEVLGLQPGDQVQVEVLEGKRPTVDLPVAGLVEDFAGGAAYLQLRAMNRLMREGDVVSGAFVAADADQMDALYRELKNSPRIASVLIKGSAIRSFRETVAENILRMRSFIVLFACVIAVGVVFNSARISLAERSRELATLRVLGFTAAEVSFILLGELALLTAAALPVGMVAGYWLAAFVIDYSYNTELFRMPLVVYRSTYGFAAFVTTSAALGSALVVRRLIDRLDLISVLKSQE
ncbi:MAG TPA: FtsX-like permease family protein [Pirellulales bacterium]|nr:FtsX-like permease family protein [Pirellulales bacterium]